MRMTGKPKRKSKLVTVSADTYEALQNLGTMKDTFDSVIRRAMQESEKWRLVEREFFRSLPGLLYKEESVETAQHIVKWFKENGLLDSKWEAYLKEKGLLK